MTQPIIKHLLPWVLIIGTIIAAYTVFSQRTKITNEHFLTGSHVTEKQSLLQKEPQALTQADAKHLQQTTIIKQRLMQEFENSFLKQYTPLVGCESWQNDAHMVNCTNHQIKAKQVFAQEFIKTRGLPKDTFDHPQLSLTD